MNLLEQILEDREGRQREKNEADERWMRERGGVEAEERLQSYDRWIRVKLSALLVLPEEPAARARLLAQCASEMTVLVKQLRGRGWLLNGKALAIHINAVLEPIGKAQRAGKVGDFWPYFRASISRYVGANAEEIQQLARRVGAEEGAQSVGALLAGLTVIESMTELLARRAVEIGEAKQETLRAKQARLRAKEAERRAEGEQPSLF